MNELEQPILWCPQSESYYRPYTQYEWNLLNRTIRTLIEQTLGGHKTND